MLFFSFPNKLFNKKKKIKNTKKNIIKYILFNYSIKNKDIKYFLIIISFSLKPIDSFHS